MIKFSEFETEAAKITPEQLSEKPKFTYYLHQNEWDRWAAAGVDMSNCRLNAPIPENAIPAAPIVFDETSFTVFGDKVIRFAE